MKEFQDIDTKRANFSKKRTKSDTQIILVPDIIRAARQEQEKMHNNYDMLENPKSILEILASMPPVKKGKKGSKKKKVADM